MAAITAQERLNQVLQGWTGLLSSWCADGSLISAAETALALSSSNALPGSQALLQSLTAQWATGDFSSLPPVVLLSSTEINGALGAYASSTDSIYLNADWLLSATDQQIEAVLTEELGHFLDARLNRSDTAGDEGEVFSTLLLNPGADSSSSNADDAIVLSVKEVCLNAEGATSTNPLDTGTSPVKYNYQIIQSIPNALGGLSRAIGSYSDGSICVGGTAELSIYGRSFSGGTDVFLERLAPDGTILWLQEFGGSGYDTIENLILDQLGNAYICGSTQGGFNGIVSQSGSTPYIAKIDSSGSWLWGKLLGSGAGGESTAITIAGDGNIVIVGNITSGSIPGAAFAGGNSDIFITKISTGGNVLWSKQLGTSSDDNALSVVTGSDNSIYLGGYTNGGFLGQANLGGTDSFLLHLSSNGLPISQIQARSTSEDLISSIAFGSDGSLYATGYTAGALQGEVISSGAPSGKADGFLSKYTITPAGGFSGVWKRLYGTTGFDATTSLIKCQDGNLIIAGLSSPTATSLNNPPQDADAFGLKIDAVTGKVLASADYAPPTSDIVGGITQISDGTVFSVGVSFSYSQNLSSIRVGKTLSGFSFSPTPIGNYSLIAGTQSNDTLSASGLQAAFGGSGNDNLTPYSTIINGKKTIPFLVGGAGDDTYNINPGTWSVIADIGGGNDTISAPYISLANISFNIVNSQGGSGDLLWTDGYTLGILVDPLGTGNTNNTIESIIFKEGTYSSSTLYDLAIKSNRFLGYTSYSALQASGILDFTLGGLDPSKISDYYSAASYNSSIVGAPAAQSLDSSKLINTTPIFIGNASAKSLAGSISNLDPLTNNAITSTGESSVKSLADLTVNKPLDINSQKFLDRYTINDPGTTTTRKASASDAGFLDFTLKTGTLKSLTAEIQLATEVKANAYVKVNPNTGEAYDFTYNPVTGLGAELLDNNKNGLVDTLRIHLQDGAKGDVDGLVNGEIRDPGLLADAPRAAVYRFLRNGVHFYTTNEAERDNVIKQSYGASTSFSDLSSNPQAKDPITGGWGYKYEGIAYQALDTQGTALYRFFSPSKGYHFVTTSDAEALNVIKNSVGSSYDLSNAQGQKLLDNGWGYQFEGNSYKVSTIAQFGMNTPVYRFFNGVTGVHFYSSSLTEAKSVIANSLGSQYATDSWVTSTADALKQNPLTSTPAPLANGWGYSFEGVGWYV